MRERPLFIIAGTQSGCGKTTVALGMMAALFCRGWRVQAYKIGPDFIDPGHHAFITQRASHNLDTWMIGEEKTKNILFSYLKDADVGVIEGVMGLFDGFSPFQEAGSTAHLAKLCDIPVLLVIDASSMARSVAALVYGFLNFDRKLNIKGIILNKVGSRKHYEILKDALKDLNTKVYGYLPKDRNIFIPSRHLGLVTREDFNTNKKDWIKKLSEWIENNLELDEILNDCKVKIPIQPDIATTHCPDKSIKIGVALDNAFCFYYAENLRLLELAGAKICPFSPLHDKDIPSDLKGLYIGGGYPELYAEKLSENKQMLKHIKEFGKDNKIIYSECGGFMYLTRGIKDTKDNFYPMVGIFPFVSNMKTKIVTLGYKEVILLENTLLGPQNTTIRGHEFHYSFIKGDDSKVKKVYFVKAYNEVKTEGFCINNTIGSYIHLHFASNPEVACNFVKSCEM